ncbi:methyltransferase domain-containing protein [Achromobacter xylosoxidans]
MRHRQHRAAIGGRRGQLPGHGFFTDHDRDRARKAGRRPGCRPVLPRRDVEDPALRAGQYDAVLAFNYLHLVRDLSGTLRRIHALLADGGLFISKTGCLGDMNPLIRLALLPAMRAIGKAPYTGAFSASALERQVAAAGFEILATELHADGGSDRRRTWSRASAEHTIGPARVRAQPARRCRLVPR